jgi:hypothetical protein
MITMDEPEIVLLSLAILRAERAMHTACRIPLEWPVGHSAPRPGSDRRCDLCKLADRILATAALRRGSPGVTKSEPGWTFGVA